MKKTNKGLNKKIKVKLFLLILLLIIMVPLIVGYYAVGGNKKAVSGESEAQPETEAQTEAAAEAETQPETQAETETATEPETAAAAKTRTEALVVSPADEENWSLAIIGINYPLPDGYQPSVSAAVEGSSVQLDSRVAEQYRKMYDAAKADGCVLTPYSGYRTYSSQETTYTRKVSYYKSQGLSDEEAAAQTVQRILPAGCSEHNAGLAMDIVSASSDFVNTKEFSWLTENAQDYGFILRYPEDKTQITGVMYEPWHWRYVGVQAAKEMKDGNLCLEEYLALA